MRFPPAVRQFHVGEASFESAVLFFSTQQRMPSPASGEALFLISKAL
jgi:hypothetical protein